MDYKQGTERKLWIFLGCIALFFMIVLILGALEARATTITGSNMDGTTYKNNANYNTAWTASSSTGIDNGTEMEIGQVDGYSIYRSFLYFDTSLSGQTITAAYLHIVVSYDVSDTDFYIQVQSGMPTYPSTPLVNGNFDKSFYSGNYGQLSTASISEDTEYNITIDASIINTGGWTKICLRSSREIAGTTPSGDEEVDIYSASHATVAYRPHMQINSEPPGMITNPYPANGTNGGALIPWCHVQVNGTSQTRPHDPSPDGITEALSPSGTDVDGDWIDYSGNANLSANSSVVKVGSYSISLYRSQGFYQYPVVDYTFDSSIDISSFTNLRFWYKTDKSLYASIIMLLHVDGTVCGWIQYGGTVNAWTYLNLSMSNIDYGTANKAKVLSACKKFRFYSGDPSNTHYLNLDELNFWKNESMTIRWYENSTGSWVLRQTNSTCPNGTYWWHYTQATSYFTTYYWRVDVWDGLANTSIIYHFTTLSNPAPTQSNPSPGNGTTGISLQPWCHIQIADPNGDSMTVRWYESSTGSYVLRQTNSSASNGTYWWRYSLAILYSHTYYWKVSVTDGVTNVSVIYHFTTMANPPPVQSSEYPANETTGVALQTWTHITVSDPNGNTMEVRFYENSTYSWVIRQTNFTCSNGTYWWQYIQAIVYSNGYDWRVDVTDGVSNVSVIYNFVTLAYVAPSQSNEFPANETVGVSLQPWCSIDVTVGSDPVTINWYWITFPYILLQTNISSTSNTFWLHFTDADSYGTLYWWRVDVLDGMSNISEMYKFTTIIMHAPVQSVPSPGNGSINQAFQPWCHITVADPIGDTMTIKWYESSTGPWILRQTNGTASNGTYWWHYTQATAEVQTYYWRVDATDGTFNTSRTYHFTTTIHTPPVISNPLPVNYSMDQGISPWCRVTVSQIHGYALNVGFYEYIGASWVLIQTNSSVGNGTYWWHYIDASSPFQEYRWKVVATSYGKTSTTCFVFETISNTERYFKNLEYNDFNTSNGIYSTVSTTMCKETNGRQWVFWVGKDTSQHLCLYGTYTDNNWGKWYNLTIVDNWNSTTWISVRDAVITSNGTLVVLFLAIDGASHSWVGLLTHYPSDPLTTWHIRMVYYGSVNYYWPRMAINNTDVIAITAFSFSVNNVLAYHRFATDTWQDVWLVNYGHFRYWSAADTTGDIFIKSDSNGTFWLCWKYSTGVRVRDSKNLTSFQTINSVTYLEDFVVLKNNRLACLFIYSNKLYWSYQDSFGTFMKIEIGVLPVLLTARCSITSTNYVTIYWRSGRDLKIVGPCQYSAPAATWATSLKTLYTFSDGKPFYPSDGYNSMFPSTNIWTTSRWTFSLYNDNAPYWNTMVFYNSTPIPPTPPVGPEYNMGTDEVPGSGFIGDLWIILVIMAVGVMTARMISSVSRVKKEK